MKHFYMDCLSASWMASRHGIEFSFDGGMKYHEKTTLYADIETPIYVHPDSIHLLTPQRGDLVLASYYHKTNYVYRLVTNVFKDGFEVGGFSRYGFGETIDGREIHKIIQRNGINFIMPESEGA